MKLADTIYTARSKWGPRAETPGALARRFLDLVARLRSIDPIFADWYYWTSPTTLTELPLDTDILAQKIEDCIWRHYDDGEPEPRGGYIFVADNDAEKTAGPRHFCATMSAGQTWRDPTCSNSVLLETNYLVTPDPKIFTYAIFRAVVLALAECFEALWCSAFSDEITHLWQCMVRQHFRLAWISYVGPRFAPVVMPPKTAIVEYRPDGGILMAATDEPFNVANPAHLSVARDIEQAIAPLNALPWPPDAEP